MHIIKNFLGEYNKEEFAMNAILKDEIIGGMQFKIYSSDQSCYLELFCMDERHRYKGFGAKLYDEFEKFLISKNVYLIRLESYEFQNRKFYEDRGFEYLEKTENWFHNKTIYRMMKKL